MNGKPKSHRAVVLTALYAMHSELDGTDTALLGCIAQNANGDGRGSRPGNAAFEAATKLSRAATHRRIAKLIRLSLIERKEEHGRLASMYRLLLEHPAYPDRSPNGNECFVETSRLNDTSDVASETPRRRVEQSETSRLAPETSRVDATTPKDHPEDHPPPTQYDEQTGWEAFKSLLPKNAPEMVGAVENKQQRARLKKLIAKFGPERVTLAVGKWASARDRGFIGLKNKWLAFFAEWNKEVPPTREQIREQELASEAAAEQRSKNFGRKLFKPVDHVAEAAQADRIIEEMNFDADGSLPSKVREKFKRVAQALGELIITDPAFIAALEAARKKRATQEEKS
jgi:hypothetical protein